MYYLLAASNNKWFENINKKNTKSKQRKEILKILSHLNVLHNRGKEVNNPTKSATNYSRRKLLMPKDFK